MIRKFKSLIKNILHRNSGSNQNFIIKKDVQYLSETVNSIAMETCRQRSSDSLSSFSVTYSQACEDPGRAAEIFAKYGIIVISGIIDDKEIVNLSNNVRQVLLGSLEKAGEGYSFEDDLIVLERGKSRFKSYRERALYPKTVISVRSGADEGMIDMFNYDTSFKKDSGRLRECLSDQVILNIIQKATDISFQPENLNIYFNKDITQTRGFHVDSYGRGQIKGFLYLSDVEDVSYGPYCFVKGSHNDSRIENINKEMAKYSNAPQTDAYFFDPRNVFPILGKRGTLVISEQGGIHRGHPQVKGKERLVGVMNYKNIG